VAAFGAVVNSRVSADLGGHPALENVSADVLAPAVHTVFVLTVLIAVALVVVASLMPTRVTEPQ
jgi:hypothetical protein